MSSKEIFSYLLGLIAIVGIIASGYFAIKSHDQKKVIFELSQKIVTDKGIFDSSLSTANTTITELQDERENLKKNLENIADDYKDEKNRNEEFEDQIRDLSVTLGDLDKLAKIDEELLQKYSKVYFLNENFTPERVKKINNKYVQKGKDDQYFHARALEHLEDLLDRARRDDIDLKVISAYRSFDEQTDLKGQYTQIYGSGANTFSADQGYSEHQLGTTLDLTVDSVGGTYTSFAQSEAYEWLEKNAYKYGFILSYPEGNNFYIFEPWHWRFVGKDLARHLNRDKETFYEMDQRDIDEYLLEIFD